MSFSLSQLSSSLLASLEQTNPHLETLREVSQLVGETTASDTEGVWKTVVCFYEEFGRVPNREVIETELGDFLPPAESFTEDHYLDFIRKMKEEKVRILAHKHLSNGELDLAVSILQGRKKAMDLLQYTEQNAFEDYQRAKLEPIGVLTGCREVDSVLKGLPKGTMTTIAAPPGGGKTSFLTSLAYNAIYHGGYNVLILSLEGIRRSLYCNFLSRHSQTMGRRLSAEKMKKVLLDETEEATFKEVVEDWGAKKKGKLWIANAGEVLNFTTAGLGELARKVEQEWGEEVDVVALDYIQNTRAIRSKGASPEEFMNDVVRHFSVFASTWNKGKGVTGILLSQINRQGEIKMRKNKRADLSMLAELNSLERESHAIVALYSDERSRLSNTIFAQVIKNRDGRWMEEMVPCFYDPEVYQIGAAEFGEALSGESFGLIGGNEGLENFFN